MPLLGLSLGYRGTISVHGDLKFYNILNRNESGREFPSSLDAQALKPTTTT